MRNSGFKAVLYLTIVLASCSVSKNPARQTVLALQKGKLKDDTSHVYSLPYEKGKSHLVLQAYFGSFSHKNSIAIDFRMKRGTKVVAARDGVVVRSREDNTKGGWDREYRQYANFVVVEHNDGTRSGYWHLQQNGVLVNIGDTVKVGDVIALSGKTGYSATPHLHFIVWNSSNGQWRQLPARFKTKKGPRYLRPYRRYRNK